MLDPKVSIIILHLDNQLALRECLVSCQRIQYSNYEIIVVQNGSLNPLDLLELQTLASRVSKVIKSPVNLGFAKGNNLGIKDALAQDTEYVLLLNDDTVVAPEFLEALVRTGEEFSNVGALCPAIYYFDEPQKIWFAGAWYDPDTCTLKAPDPDHLDRKGDTRVLGFNFLTGCCVLVKRKAIEKIGLLDERFFLYCEDADWMLRMKAAGFQMVVVTSSRIWHKVSVSSGGADSPIKVYHKVRSHLLLAQLHWPQALPRLQRANWRDIGWLLFKSSDATRFRKALAYLAAMKDYYLGRLDKGPEWLWRGRAQKSTTRKGGADAKSSPA